MLAVALGLASSQSSFFFCRASCICSEPPLHRMMVNTIKSVIDSAYALCSALLACNIPKSALDPVAHYSNPAYRHSLEKMNAIGV